MQQIDVAALEQSNSEREASLQTILALARIPQNQAALFRVPELVARLIALGQQQQNNNNARIKRLALRTLYLLCSEQANKRGLVQTPGLVSLLVAESNDEGGMKPLSALVSLLFEQDNLADLFRFPGLVNTFVNVATKQDMALCDVALAGLACLTFEVRNKWTMITEPGVVELLMRFSKQGEEDEELVQSSLIALHNLRQVNKLTSLWDEDSNDDLQQQQQQCREFWQHVGAIWTLVLLKPRLPHDMIRLVFNALIL